MRALNMREGDTQRQTELVFDLYKDNLEDIMDSNIDDGVSGRNNSLRRQNQAHQLFNQKELFRFYLNSLAKVLGQ